MAETRSSVMANMEHAKDRQKTLERIQSEVRGSKTLYEASAIAQEKHVLSQRIKNTLLIISYCSRKASLSKECKPSS